MAEHLASIYGTEKDKVNCSFYFKIGACRHGERCSRKHVKPNFSQTVMITNFYQSPAQDPSIPLTDEQIQEHFDLFYEDIFMEFCKYGEVEEMRVCDNVGDHLVGNVYVRFAFEEDAQRAMDELNNRFYAGRPLWVELSPVTDFIEACCRQNETGECDRGGFCNFMHLVHPTRSLLRELEKAQQLSLQEKRGGAGGGSGSVGGGSSSGRVGGGGSRSSSSRHERHDRHDRHDRRDRDRNRERGRDDRYGHHRHEGREREERHDYHASPRDSRHRRRSRSPPPPPPPHAIGAMPNAPNGNMMQGQQQYHHA